MDLNCPQRDGTTIKIDDITSALKEELQRSCVCSITKNDIAHEPLLVCSDTLSHFVTYRSGLSGTSYIDSQMLISYIQDWVSNGPNVQVLSSLLKIDDECPVSITTYDDDLCVDVITTASESPNISTTPNHSQQSTDTSGAITGGILAILVIVIGLVVVLVLLRRGCHGELSFRKTKQYVH